MHAVTTQSASLDYSVSVHSIYAFTDKMLRIERLNGAHTNVLNLRPMKLVETRAV